MWEYLAEIPRMVAACDSFSVFTHIDYAVRAWPVAEAGPLNPRQFEEGFRHAMRALAESGRALEMNTRRLWSWVPQWWSEEGGSGPSPSAATRTLWMTWPAVSPRRWRWSSTAGSGPGRNPQDFWTR